MKLVYLILKKTFKFVATRRQILRLKCTKFNFGWRSAPDPAGALTTLPDLIAEFNRPTFGWQIGNSEGKGGMGANERRGKRPGPKRVGSHPVYENLEKYPDYRTDLIGHGRQHGRLPRAANTVSPPLSLTESISFEIANCVLHDAVATSTTEETTTTIATTTEQTTTQPTTTPTVEQTTSVEPTTTLITTTPGSLSIMQSYRIICRRLFPVTNCVGITLHWSMDSEYVLT